MDIPMFDAAVIQQILNEENEERFFVKNLNPLLDQVENEPVRTA
jgi:hypothetical protein